MIPHSRFELTALFSCYWEWEIFSKTLAGEYFQLGESVNASKETIYRHSFSSSLEVKNENINGSMAHFNFAERFKNYLGRVILVKGIPKLKSTFGYIAIN